MPIRTAARPLLGLLVLAAAPCAAQASVTTVGYGETITVTQVDETGGGPAERQTITVSDDPSGNLYIASTAAVATTAPCAIAGERVVACPPRPSADATLMVSTGRGDDEVTLSLAESNRTGIIAIDVAGGAGRDTLRGGPMGETLRGDSRTGLGTPISGQELTSELAGDYLFGGGGRDTLHGDLHPDYLNGNGTPGASDPGNTLIGGSFGDFYDAGATPGPDAMIEAPGPDEQNFSIVVPGGGEVGGRGDTVSYASRVFAGAGPGVTARMGGGSISGVPGEGDTISPEVESLIGTIRDDTLTGNARPNVLTGGLGVDSLNGQLGADTYRLRDGMADLCPALDERDTVDLDLVDPAVTRCTPGVSGPPNPPPPSSTLLSPPQRTLLPTLTITRKPVDERIGYVTLGRVRAARGVVRVAVTCPKGRTCSGSLRLSPGAASTPLVARAAYRVPAGRTRTVRLAVSRAGLRRLRAAGLTRIAAVARGTSKKGPTTVLAHRRL
ncbi:MAG: hypothetical protein JHC84_18615 [Solirubrobacteraceae bacterium]|nr:hypothetical protein [Solirubrobacteraceae bacterium]